MKHIQIYKKLEKIEDTLHTLYNKVGFSDEITALQDKLTICTMNDCAEMMAVLENKKKFCVTCMYINLKTMQQALSKYFKLVKLEDVKTTNLDFPILYQKLFDVEKELKDLTIDLSYQSKGQDCVIVNNSAYQELKIKIPLRELRDEDEFDENDE